MFLTKALVKSFYIILIVKVINISCDDHSFIVNKYDGSEFFCVTNSSSALSWIIEDTTKQENLEKQVSSFFPKSYKPWTADCNEFKEQDWSCINSISDKIILDRRWESFTIHKTDYNDTLDSLLEFTTLAENLSSDFTIPLSIRINQEAHVHFCEGNNVPSSNCYWVILMGFGGKKSVVRKCPMNTIPSKNGITPKCNITLIEYPVDETGRFLTKKKWSHFQFKKLNNSITLEDEDGKEIIGFTDNNSSYTVTNMIIRSKGKVGLWKLHELSYFYINKTKNTEFKNLTPINDVVCFSGFVKICLSCTIKFEIKDENGDILRGKEFSTKDLNWKEIEFYKSSIKTNVNLVITTTKPNKENNPFWELDDIKQCSSQGFRIIYLEEPANCQLLSSKKEPLQLSKRDSSVPNTKSVKCKEDSVSTYCIPCSVFMKEPKCGKLKICESYGTSQQCWCSAGYEYDDKQKCNKNCKNGLYGHQCQHNCSVQCSKCDPVTGKCDTCKNEYSGDRCHIQRSGPVIDLNVRWSLENHLEINWKHPVEANGEIQSFNISVLPMNEKLSNHNIFRNLYISSPDDYKRQYLYTIKTNKLLASREYRIKVQAYNGLNGNVSSLTDVSPPEIPILETDPEILPSNHTIRVKTSRIPHFWNGHKYKLFLFILNESQNFEHYQDELTKFQTNFNITLSHFTLLYECNDYENSTQFLIGRTNHSTNDCNNLTNVELTPGTNYNITILLVHSDSNKSSYKLYSYKKFTTGTRPNFTPDLSLLALLLLLLIIPMVIFMYAYKKNKDTKLKNTDEPQEMKIKSTQPLPKTTQSIAASHFNQNLQSFILNNTLKQQHQELLELFQNIYEKLLERLEFEHFDLNFADNSKITKAYVVCDFPKIEQASSFWNEIWKENIENIILMDNLCFQQNYWPGLNARSVYKNLIVQCVWEEIFPEYEFRKFTLTVKGSLLGVNHFRFTSWYNQDLPEHLTCLHFFRKISQIQMKPESPLLFHSSVGLKATGFALLCDMSVRNAEKDQVVDVFGIAQQLADCSTKLVDDYKCYELAHFVVLECLLASGVDIDVDFNFQDSNVKSLFKEEKFQKFLAYMNETKWIDRNREISRESYLYFFVDGPQYTGATVLKPCYPRAEINATLQNFEGIVIQSPKGKKNVLIRQPTSKDVKLIWKIVTEMKISEILILNKIQDREARFWVKNSVHLGNVTIKSKSTKKLHNYHWISLTISIDGKTEENKIEIFEVQNWSSQSLCPPNVKDFVNFCLETYSRTNNSNPMLVICRDGTTASSLYSALYYNIHKIQKEQRLDVCTSARLVRKYCTEFAEKEEQLKFLWEATKECANQQSLYEVC